MLNPPSANSTPPPPPSAGPSTYYQAPYPHPHYNPEANAFHPQFQPYHPSHHPPSSHHHRPPRSKSRRGSYNSRANYHHHYPQTYHQPPYYSNIPPYAAYQSYPPHGGWPPYYQPPHPSQAITPTSPAAPARYPDFQPASSTHDMQIAGQILTRPAMEHTVEENGVSEEISVVESIPLPEELPEPAMVSTDESLSSAEASDVGGWVIWSRRPQDPTNAPGIIFSPRTKPPSSVKEQALDIPTPPPSPPPLPSVSLPAEDHNHESHPPTSDQSIEAVPQNEVLSILSSSATETTPTTTRPASPASSSTSFSISNSQLKATNTTSSSSTSDAAAAQGTSSPLDASQPITTVTSDLKAAQASASEPPAPSVPPVKKSWASLLRPEPGGAASRSQLPVSSVVGFSVPAEAIISLERPKFSDAKRDALLGLLTGRQAANDAPPSGYAGAAAATPPKIVLPPMVDMQRVRPRGLVNSGNMCFANAVLQVLVYCPTFHSAFAELGRLLPPRKNIPMTSGSDPKADSEASSSAQLVRATADFLQEFMTKPPPPTQGSLKGKERVRNAGLELADEDWDSSFLPTAIYDAMKEKSIFDTMRGGQQEDAEEFFGFYLDALEEELLALSSSLSPAANQSPVSTTTSASKETAVVPEDGWVEVGKRNRTVITRTVKNTESIISRIFGGKSRSTLKAPGQKDSAVLEDWRSLRLDIQREQVTTVQEALAHISDPQSVQLTYPSRPGVIVDASQQVLLESLPPILVLHVKRFCYDTTVGGVVKVSKHIRFDPELHIGTDLLSTSMRSRQATRYRLFGVIYHHGVSAGGGHYTLDVLHPSRFGPGKEGWVRMDDELVSDVNANDVFGTSERDETRCAYLLFYRKVGPAGK